MFGGFVDVEGSGTEFPGYGDDVSTTVQPTPALTTTPVPVVTSSASVMNHVTVMDATEGVAINGRPPVMNHVTVHNSSANGITFDSFLRGNFTLHNCSILASKGRGIYFHSSTQLSNARLTMDACTVEDSGEAGIYVDSNVNITVVGSNVHRNAKSGCIFTGRPVSSREGIIIFNGNSVSENRMHGLKLNGAAHISIKNNDFSRNVLTSDALYSTLHFVSGGYVDMAIWDNNFTDNINYYIYHYWGIRYRHAYTVYIGQANRLKLQVSVIVEMFT